jgi:hypothetical protein
MIKTWLARLLSEGDGSPSTKRVLFAIALLASIIFCAIDLGINRHLTSVSADLCKCAIYATAGAYGVGRCAEANESNKQP